MTALKASVDVRAADLVHLLHLASQRQAAIKASLCIGTHSPEQPSASMSSRRQEFGFRCNKLQAEERNRARPLRPTAMQRKRRKWWPHNGKRGGTSSAAGL